MTDPRNHDTVTGVKKQIAAARKQASAADTAVAKISADLLRRALAMSPRQADTLVADARLTRTDREKLRRHLAQKLPVTVPKARRKTPNILPLLNWSLGHLRATSAVIAVAVIGICAWNSTPQPVAVGKLRYDLEARWPDGQTQQLKAGDIFAVTGGDPQGWRVRIWRLARGYESAILPRDSLVSTDG